MTSKSIKKAKPTSEPRTPRSLASIRKANFSSLEERDSLLRTLPVQVFEEDNAKYLDREDTVNFFVVPPGFERLMSRKNHVLLGSRGSGKTTWVRMLAHDHVVLAAAKGSATATEMLAKKLIGVYIPANIGIVGSLATKIWPNEVAGEHFFQWRMNIHSCASAIAIMRSCLDLYVTNEVDRMGVEARLCRALSNLWTNGTRQENTLSGLRDAILDIEAIKLTELERARVLAINITPNDYFDCELFQPLKHALQKLETLQGAPSACQWLICVDEAEYLTVAHHRALNTLMRASSGNVVYKIATMPFAHHTLQTNIGVDLVEGQDFEYVSVDQNPVDVTGEDSSKTFRRFARAIFKQRVAKVESLKDVSLFQLLGGSPLLDPKDIKDPHDEAAFFELVRQFASERTVLRAEDSRGTDKYKSSIQRKMHGALLLRRAIAEQKGNNKMRVYCGEAMLIRCSDGNMRRFLRLVNALVKAAQQHRSLPIEAGVQNDTFVLVANQYLNRLSGEDIQGSKSKVLLQRIGEYMGKKFSTGRLSADQISGIEVRVGDPAEIHDFVRQAVQLAYLIPARGDGTPATVAALDGVFHLAFVFAPLFRCLPRRHKSARIHTMLKHENANTTASSQLSIYDGAS
ncbi:MAG: hypothetical protein ABL985_07730 [Casimicrobium sp.]